MKIVPFKFALGAVAATVFVTGAHADVPVPGHALKPLPGETAPTATQVIDRCRAAYAALTSYEVTSSVITHALSKGVRQEYQNSAVIQFVRPGKIHAEGTEMGGQHFAYVSDGVGTEEMLTGDGSWKTSASPEMAIAAATGVAQDAATTVPALLLKTNWGTPLLMIPGKVAGSEVREDTVDGQPCYVLTAQLASVQMSQTESLWIDEKTYLIRRTMSDTNMSGQTMIVAGKSFPVVAIKSHMDNRFTNERLNEAISDSTFTLPPTQ